MLSLRDSLEKLNELYSEISDIRTEIDNLSIDDINYYDHTDAFNDYLDRTYGSIQIEGVIFYSSELLEAFDNSYYEECLKDYIHNEIGIRNTDEYYDLIERLDAKENEYNSALEDTATDFNLTIDEIESRGV